MVFRIASKAFNVGLNWILCPSDAVDCQQLYVLIIRIKAGWAERFDELDFLGGGGELFKGALLRHAADGCEIMRLTKQAHLCTCRDARSPAR